MATLLESSPRFFPTFPTLTPTFPSTPLDFGGRLISTSRNFSTPRPLIGSPIVVGEGPTSTGKCTHCIKVFSHSLVSDKVRSPDRMSTTHNTPQSTSPGEQMDIDTPPLAVRYQNRYADDFLQNPPPASPDIHASPASEMSLDTPTQPPAVPSLPPRPRAHRYPSPVPFRLAVQHSHIQLLEDSPRAEVTPIEAVTAITVPVGDETVVFRNLCDTLDKALQEWNENVSDYDKENEESSDAIILNLPAPVSERLIYGRRTGENRFWEGQILVWPGKTYVAKLKKTLQEPAIYGVWIGMIDEFWNDPDGVHVLYGADKKIYTNPGSDGGRYEGNWKIFWVEGGWDPREFSADKVIDQFEFRRNKNLSLVENLLS
jgi:hypothetical protein